MGHMGLSHNLCFIFKQPFKNVKTILSSWARQKQVGRIQPVSNSLLNSYLDSSLGKDLILMTKFFSTSIYFFLMSSLKLEQSLWYFYTVFLVLVFFFVIKPVGSFFQIMLCLLTSLFLSFYHCLFIQLSDYLQLTLEIKF